MGYFNPLLKLPAAKRLSELSPESAELLSELLKDLRHQANAEAENAWKRKKGPMAAYWRAVATYARHVRHAITKR